MAGDYVFVVRAKFLAKPGYVGIDGALSHYHIVAPYILNYFLAGVNSVLMGEEEKEYVEFGAGELQTFAIEQTDFVVAVYAQIVECDVAFVDGVLGGLRY